MDNYFKYDERLGINIPSFTKEWGEYSKQTQSELLLEWEKIRGRIPDRIKELEHLINEKQAQLNVEPNFEKSCEINSEISSLASVINDLWLWYRLNQTLDSKTHL